MKNPHGVEPTHYMKRKESKYAIKCIPNDGPIFGNNRITQDISIHNNCNKKDSCYIHNDGKHGYECHHEYKKSLFVNTAEPNNRNYFSVLDYEVYTHNESKCDLM